MKSLILIVILSPFSLTLIIPVINLNIQTKNVITPYTFTFLFHSPLNYLLLLLCLLHQQFYTPLEEADAKETETGFDKPAVSWT